MSAINRAFSSRQGVVQNVAIGAASASSNAFGSQTYQVRLCATVACDYVVTEGTEGTTVAATTSNGAFLPPNVIEYVTVTPGQKITVIESAATGNLNIVELS